MSSRNRIWNFILGLCLLGPNSVVHAQSVLPATFTVEGRLYNSQGEPWSSTSTVTFQLELVADNCVIYKETQSNVNLNSSDPTALGVFALPLGMGTATSGAYSGSLFLPGTFSGVDGSCNITAAAGDARLVRVKVSQDGGNTFETLSPDTLITATPTATVADSLQGLTPSSFILTNTNTSLQQASVENVFSTENYNKLLALINGTSNSYLPLSPSSAVSLNGQTLTNVAAPSLTSDAVNKGYADGNLYGKTLNLAGITNGQTLVWNATASDWVAQSPGSVTYVATGNGLLGGGFSNSGTLSVDVGTTANKVLQLSASAQIPAVDGALLMNVNATRLAGRSLAAAVPSAGQVLTWNVTTAQWEAANTGGVTGLSGDVVASGSGVINATIQSNAVNLTSKINSGTTGPNQLLMTDSTTGQSVAFGVCGVNGQVLQWTPTGWQCGNVSALIGNNSVAAGTYGSPSFIPQISVDATGRVTSLSNVNVPVLSVNGRTGDVVLNGADLGLGTAATQNYGTAAGDLVQLDSGGLIPSSLMTNVTLLSKSLASGLPTGAQVLTYNASLGKWDAENVPTITNAFTQGGNSFGAAAVLGTKDLNPLQLQTNGTTALFISTSGTVGIGTTNSQSFFDVEAGSVTGANGSNITLAAQSGAGGTTTPFNGGNIILTPGNCSGTGCVQGEVGIGTTAPHGTLEVNSGNSLATSLVIKNSDSWPATLQTDSNSDFTFINGGSERMNLDSYGRLGIGTHSPAAIVDIYGLGNMSALIVPRDSTTNRPTAINGMIRYATDTSRFEVYQNGSWQNMLSSGGVSSVSGGTGLLGGTFATNGTLSVDVGTAANKILQVTASGIYPADDGSLISNVNAARIGTRSIATSVPVSGQVLAWNTVNGDWEPSAASTGTVTSVVAGPGLIGGSITSTGTLSVDVGTAAGKILQVSASGVYPADDGSLISNVNASRIGTRAMATSSPVSGQVLTWNSANGDWEPSNASSGTVTTVVSGVGLVPGTLSTSGTLNIDVGTAANKIVQFTSTALYPLNDGSLIANVNAARITSKPVSMTAPVAGQVLQYNSTLQQWVAQTLPTDQWTTSGANIYYASGKVGIGTTGPLANLDVSASGASATSQISTFGAGFTPTQTFFDSRGSSTVPTGVNSGDSLGLILFTGQYGTAIYNQQIGADIRAVATENYGLNGSGANLIFETQSTGSTSGATPRMTITANGSVGVGTTSPNGALDVYASGNTSALLVPRDSTVNRPTTGVNGMIRYATDTGKFEAYQNGAWSNLIASTNGTITNVTSGVGLTAGSITSIGTLNVDVGTGANKILQLTSTGVYPADDGYQISNVNAALLAGKPLVLASPTAGQVLTYNGSTGKWDAETTTNSLVNFVNGGNSFGAAASLGTNDGNSLSFKANNYTAMTILPSGNIGIGSSQPAAILDVEGAGSIFLNAGMVGIGTSSLASYSNQFTIYGPANNAVVGEAIVVNGTGNSRGALQIGATGQYSEFGTTGFDYTGGFGVLGSQAQYMYNNYGDVVLVAGAGNNVRFATNGASAANEVMRITPTAKVGIGTNNPGAILDVNGLGTALSAIIIPRDTVGNRPSTGVNGMIRYATDTGKFEAYQNGTWQNLISATNGTLTDVIAGGGLLGGSITSIGTLSVDVGTAANKILQVTSTGIHPALDGSLMTNLNAVRIGTRPVSTNTPAGNQVLTWNTSNTDWEPVNPVIGGTVSSVIAGSGLLGGAITSVGTLTVDVGTAANKILQVTSAGVYPGDDGFQITNVNAAFLSGKPLSLVNASAGQVLTYNGTINKWDAEPSNFGSAFVNGGNSFGADATLGTNDSKNLSLKAGGSIALTVAPAGNIGIGTSAPTTSMVDIEGGNSVRHTDTFTVNGGTSDFGYGGNINLTAQSAQGGGNNNGGNIILTSGMAAGSGAPGTIQLLTNTVTLPYHGAQITSQGLYGIDVGAGYDGTTSVDLVSYYGIRFVGNYRNPTSPASMSITANGQIGIGTTAPAAILDVVGYSGQSALIVPRDSTGNRPTTPINGMIRYATDTSRLEAYQNGSWQNMISATNGTLTSVSAGSGLLGGAITSVGTLSVDVGTSANKILQVTSTGIHPALDGSLMTNLNAVRIGTHSVSTSLPTSTGQVLAWNAVNSDWEPTAASTGTVSSVNTGVGLTGGPISNTGTLAVDVGTASNKILQITSNGLYPSVDGSLITNVNTARLAGQNVSATVPTAAQTLVYNATLHVWQPQFHWQLIGTTLSPFGSVGIGTATTTYPFDIEGAPSGGLFKMMSTSNYASIDLFDSAGNQQAGIGWGNSGATTWTNSIYINTQNPNPVEFGTNNTERLRIDAGGRVGIGTSSPQAILDVYGTGTGQSAILIPRDSTLNRPPGSINGMMRYNTSTSQFEFLQAGSWVNFLTTANNGVTNLFAGTGLVANTITSVGTLSVDVGTAANKILQVTSAGIYPGVDGSLISNVNASRLQTRNVSNVAPSPGQILGWNYLTQMWEPRGQIGIATGLVNNTLGNGTLAVDVGTAANKILQVTSSGIYPPDDGSLITNLNATSLGGAPVSSQPPTAGQILVFNSTSNSWQAQLGSFLPLAGGTMAGSINMSNNTIASVGAIGIGTSSPTYQLHIQQADGNPQIGIINSTSSTPRYPSVSIYNYMNTQSSGSPVLSFYNARGTQAVPTATQPGDLLGAIQSYGSDGTNFTVGGNSNAAILFIAHDAFTTTDHATDIVFKNASNTGFTESMRIGSTGNVGIGTSAPGQLLDLQSTSTGVNAYISMASNASAGVDIKSFGANSNSSIVLQNSRGSLAAPAANQSGDPLGDIVYQDFNFTNSASIYVTATENHSGSAAGSQMQFFTTPNGSTATAPRITISNGGNVGIGTTSPAAALDVVGSENVSGSMTAMGNVTAKHFLSGTSGSLTAVFNTGTGSTQAGNMTITSVTGTDVAQTIAFTLSSQSSSSTNQPIVTVTFATPFPTAPVCLFSPGSKSAANAFSGTTEPYITTSTTGYILMSGAVPLGVSLSPGYIIYVHCLD